MNRIKIFVFCLFLSTDGCLMPPSIPQHLRQHITSEAWNYYRDLQLKQVRRNGGCPRLVLGLEQQKNCEIEVEEYTRVKGQCRSMHGIGTCAVFNASVAAETMIWPGHRACGVYTSRRHRTFINLRRRKVSTSDTTLAKIRAREGFFPQNSRGLNTVTPRACYVVYREKRNYPGKCILLQNGEVYACRSEQYDRVSLMHRACATTSNDV